VARRILNRAPDDVLTPTENGRVAKESATAEAYDVAVRKRAKTVPADEA
jgi:hypothetical protein